MSTLSRIGVALDSSLLERFDHYIAAQGHNNRSEAFRDLIRDRLNASRLLSPKALVVGTVTHIYEVIISTVHSHLDHDMCLEVVVVKGRLGEVQELSDRLIGIKGVQHGKLVMSSPDAYLPPPDQHPNPHPPKHRHSH